MQQDESRPARRLRGEERERGAREVLARWKASGLGRAAFCRQEGMATVTLRRWLAEFGPPGQAAARSRFVEARLPASSGAAFEVELANGLRLHVPRGSDPAEVEPLVRALQRC